MIIYQLNKILWKCKEEQCESLPEFCFVQSWLRPCTAHRPRPCLFFPGALEDMLYASPSPGWTLASFCSFVCSLVSGPVFSSFRLDFYGMTPEADNDSLVCASWTPLPAPTSACRTGTMWDLIPLVGTHSQLEPPSDPAVCSWGAALFLLLPDAHI